MYSIVSFIHVISVFGFLLAHGASAAAAFALRRERSLERVQALLALSSSSLGLTYLTGLTLLASGVAAGFMGGWWRQGWIWASLLLLAAIVVVMVVWGSNVYGPARKTAGLPYFERGKTLPAEPPASPAELDAILSRGNPMLLAVFGYGGIAAITWLMMYKPF